MCNLPMCLAQADRNRQGWWEGGRDGVCELHTVCVQADFLWGYSGSVDCGGAEVRDQGWRCVCLWWPSLSSLTQPSTKRRTKTLRDEVREGELEIYREWEQRHLVKRVHAKVCRDKNWRKERLINRKLWETVIEKEKCGLWRWILKVSSLGRRMQTATCVWCWSGSVILMNIVSSDQLFV